MKRYYRIALSLLLCLAASPVLAGPPYNVADPSTLEVKHYSILAVYQSSQVAGSETYALPSLTLSYGLTNSVELDLGMGLAAARSRPTPTAFGLGDTTVGFKWRFQEETRRRPQFAFGYTLKLPTADPRRGLGSGAADHSLFFTAAKSYKRWMTFANLGFVAPGSSLNKNNVFYGLGVTYQATERLILGAQVYGNSPAAPGARDELAWGVGATYNTSPDTALMLQVGRSEHGFSDLNITAGFGFTWK